MIENAGLVERLEEAAKREPLLLSLPPQETKACKLYSEAAQRIRELEAALAAETERCAGLAEHMYRSGIGRKAEEVNAARAIAAAIRAGAPR